MAVKGVGSLVPIYLLTRVGVSEVLTGGLLALGPGAQILLNPYFRRAVDRSSPKRVIVIGIAISGAYAVILAAASLPIGTVPRILTAGTSFVFVAAGFAAMDIGALGFIGDAVPAGSHCPPRPRSRRGSTRRQGRKPGNVGTRAIVP